MSNSYPHNVAHYQLPLPEPERLAKAPLPPHPFIITAPQTAPSCRSPPVSPSYNPSVSTPQKFHIPLRPLFVKHPMPTLLAPYRVTLLQLDFRVAVATEVLRCRSCLEIRAGGVVV